VQKNDIITLTVTDMTDEGLGVGRVDGLAVFVTNAVPGDTVSAVITKVLARLAYAKTLEVLTPSPDRVRPPCPNFPTCRHTMALPKNINVPCPECGAELLERVSRKGRKFYGCERYPECEFVSWDLPVKDKCPVCGGRMVYKRGAKDTAFHVCVNETCRHRVQIENENGGQDD
jgi:predicted RNA-binding protein with TRAM domain